jgi:YggT family protein
MSKDFVLTFINVSFEIINLAIIIRVFISMLRVNVNNRLLSFIINLTDPFLDLAKKITPRIGVFDFSPVVALIALDIIQWILISALHP